MQTRSFDSSFCISTYPRFASVTFIDLGLGYILEPNAMDILNLSNRIIYRDLKSAFNLASIKFISRF
jgi:hypothetical protein